ncbi:MAG: carboxypeptidase regulatory-like domain-containing protein, partial [Pseudomonadota bacterium]
MRTASVNIARRLSAWLRKGVMQLSLLSCLAITVIALTPDAAFAQETSSSIRGKIYAADGNPVAGATVVVEDQRTGIERGYTSNGSGTFLATRLPVGGPYKVTVNGNKTVAVDSVALGEIYNLTINLQSAAAMEELVVVGQAAQAVDVAAGPAATFGLFELETSVSINRDISDVYAIDPRLNLDADDDGFQVNCAGKHPRFNSITLDGVSQDDRFGLNDNGYSTAVGQPFPYDAIEQVAVELAPFDVTYGGFSACNINAVTKSGTNEWDGNVFYEYSDEGLKGRSIDGEVKLDKQAFDESRIGFSIGGPIIKDKLFIFAAYSESERPRFLARGFNGSGVGEERDWLSQADFDRIVSIANNVYNYDPGGQPSDGAQEDEKYMVRVDWNINDNHNAAVIYNYYDGFQDRDSDGDADEFEFANHFYKKGSESDTLTFKLSSQWTDAFSSEIFYSQNEMIDSQVTVGPPDFGDFQISIDRDTVYLGADDSRQANRLNTESKFFKLSGQLLVGDHVLTGGFESEELTIFNQFVQHARGGEYDFFDDSVGNPAFCDALTAQGRFDDAACGLSGIDRFELGRPSRIYYGSGGGTNNPDDAAANFSNTLNAIYLKDEYFWDAQNLTIVAGIRYEFFD